MKDRLAEVVDEVVITGQNTDEKMCSCESDVVGETCSSESYDARGSRYMSTKSEFVEILEFAITTNLQRWDSRFYNDLLR